VEVTLVRALRSFACLPALLFILAPVADAGAVRVPGTRVSLEPPAGFEPADRFPGFQRPDTASSIMVTEIPGPYEKVRGGMSGQGLASRGMTLLHSEPAAVPGAAEGLLVHVHQQAADTLFAKWMVVCGDGSASVLVTATFPESLAEALEAPLRRAVLSTVLAREGPADTFEGLPFRVDPGPGLRIASRMGNMLSLAPDGASAPLAPGVPRCFVGLSVDEADLTDLRAFAEDRARRTVTVRGVRVLRGRPRHIDGLEAWELEADATHSESGLPLRLYQVVLSEGRHHVLILGMVEASRAADYVPAFRHVAESFTRRPPRP
jgi:hypothetical protein